MLGAGYFTPLDGFRKKDVISVANKMQLDNGPFWPTVVNLTNQNFEFKEGESISVD